MALFLDIGPGDVLRIGEDAVVTLEHKSGRRARLRITGIADVQLLKDPPQESEPAEPLEVLNGRRT